MRNSDVVTVAQIDRFDEVVDVRSPSEYALDHVPGAVSCPVLDDEERARIGTLYKQVSPFEAKKLGAALIARNIARHIEGRFAGRDRRWKPLVYCWRGGKRSAALAHVLREIGWHAATLEGGYKAYRREIVAQLERLPQQFGFVVVCGATGSGKSRLLEALSARGVQVLDLERLACHRGSVLGDLPEEPQPAQKMLDSLVWNTLRHFSPGRPVIVEAESRKIGRLQVTDALLEKMRNGRCLRIEAPLPERVRFLMEEYRHFLEDPAALKDKLSCLSGLYGREVIGRWLAQADAGRWHELVADLLLHHYDPAYRRSTRANYRGFPQAAELRLESLAPESIGNAADELVRRLAL